MDEKNAEKEKRKSRAGGKLTAVMTVFVFLLILLLLFFCLIQRINPENKADVTDPAVTADPIGATGADEPADPIGTSGADKPADPIETAGADESADPIETTGRMASADPAETTGLSGSAGPEQAAEQYELLDRDSYISWLLDEMTFEEKAGLLNGDVSQAAVYGTAGCTRGLARLNIRPMLVADGEEGINTNLEATQLPAAVMLAASWDTRMAYEYGSVIGAEAAALGVGMVLAPRVNIVRDACSGGNGGNYQTLGEDPLLNGLIGAAEVNGIQSRGTAACMKQMFGSSTGAAQGAALSVMDEQTLREVYLQPFQILLENSSPEAAMTNYSCIGIAGSDEKTGTSVAEKSLSSSAGSPKIREAFSDYLPSSAWNWNELLRNQMNFAGVVIPDWGRLAGTECLAAGVDWNPTGSGGYYSEEALRAAIDAGTVSMEDVDQAVRNLLTLLYEEGYLSPDTKEDSLLTGEEGSDDEEGLSPDKKAVEGENLSPDTEETDAENTVILGSLKEADAQTAEETAISGAVLLKNEEGLLPLSEEEIRTGKVVLIGYPAAEPVQPSFKEAASGFYEEKQSPREALAELLGIETGEIPWYVGADLMGEAVPLSDLCCTTEDGERKSGLFCRQEYETVGCGETAGSQEVNASGESSPASLQEAELSAPKSVSDSSDQEVFSFLGDQAVVGEDEAGNHTSLTFSGQIYAEESGEYRINVVQRFPDDSDYEDPDKTAYSGSLTVDGQVIGSPTRLAMNGAANAASSVSVADLGDGYRNWNLCGGYITLEAGYWYSISFTVSSLYGEDMEFLLTWVTPSAFQEDLEAAARGAQEAETAIVFIWQDAASSSVSGESRSGAMKLQSGQEELVKAVEEVCDHVVVVCYNGDAFDLSSFADGAEAILEMWWPGQEGAEAAAKLLTGAANPSGRLPVSFPVSEEESMARETDHRERYGNIGGDPADLTNAAFFTEGIENGYRYYIKDSNTSVLYEFGYGLSYTDFSWSDFSLAFSDDGSLEVTLTVTNTGSCAGRDVVELYLGAPEVQEEGVQFSECTLAGFAKTELLAPGETEVLTVTIPYLKLCYWDAGETGALSDQEKEELLALGGAEEEEAKRQAAEWYEQHLPDTEGQWRLAEGKRRLYAMKSADWDQVVWETELDIQS